MISVVPRVEEVLPVEVKGGYNATEAAITAMSVKSAAGGFGARPAAEAKESKEGDAPAAAAAAVPAQPSFYDIISQEAPITGLLRDVTEGFSRITVRQPGQPSRAGATEEEDLTTHKESFSNFGHLWQVDRGRWMARYAKVGAGGELRRQEGQRDHPSPSVACRRAARSPKSRSTS